MLTALLLHVTLAVPPTPAVPPVVVHAAVAEASGVWAPYGVAVDAAAPCGWASDTSTLLTVVADATRHPSTRAGWRGALGSIAFTTGGAPAPAITVYLADIEQFLAGARALGVPAWAWPRSLHDEVFGRVLGRVLAHEIGHYVLRSRHHAPDGLMRSLQFADDMVTPSRHRFMLTPAEAARLEDRR